jgi:predicted secreted protein
VTTVTVADDGSTVRLHRGQSLTVVLDPTGLFSWHLPTVTGAGLRQVNASGGYPDQQPARATFLATQSGTATLQAIDDTACLHATPACLPPQRQWRVTVTVD